MARDMAPASPQPVRDYLEDRLREWDARLLAATELAASVEADPFISGKTAINPRNEFRMAYW